MWNLQKLERKLDFLDLSILKNYIIYFLTNSPTESWVPYNITVAAYCRLFSGKSYEFLANTVQEIKKEDSKEDVLYNKYIETRNLIGQYIAVQDQAILQRFYKTITKWFSKQDSVIRRVGTGGGGGGQGPPPQVFGRHKKKSVLSPVAKCLLPSPPPRPYPVTNISVIPRASDPSSENIR